MWASPGPSRGVAGAQAGAGRASGSRDAEGSERHSGGRTAIPRPCGHTVLPNREYCPSCRAWQYDTRYLARHAGHDIVETAATRADGRHYRQCITCAPWREPLAPTRGEPDPMAIDRAIHGDSPERMRPVERRAAIRALANQLPAPLIAQRIGCSERTVWRHLAAA